MGKMGKVLGQKAGIDQNRVNREDGKKSRIDWLEYARNQTNRYAENYGLDLHQEWPLIKTPRNTSSTNLLYDGT